MSYAETSAISIPVMQKEYHHLLVSDCLCIVSVTIVYHQFMLLTSNPACLRTSDESHDICNFLYLTNSLEQSDPLRKLLVLRMLLKGNLESCSLGGTNADAIDSDFLLGTILSCKVSCDLIAAVVSKLRSSLTQDFRLTASMPAFAVP